jgi:hypothetical protein
MLMRRLFSLSGLVPLGAFLATHAALNAWLIHGARGPMRALDRAKDGVVLAVFEAVFVLAPLAFHAGFGLWLVATRRPLAQPSPYPPAVARMLRATGVFALLFLAMHLPELRLRLVGVGAHPHSGELETLLAQDLSSVSHGVPWRGVAYLAGAGCAAAHFAGGLWAWLVGSSGWPFSDRGRRRAGWVAAALGASIWLVFADAVVFHATGAPLVGTGRLLDEAGPACPVK